ncbi:ribonuclease T2-like [Orbilia ellipsospora]|uniref:Ribonuclease T2-like n=1 Tax=Orbilia ellipsospora TaxID=2528407 RepID=A0AAV9XA20_9PEZI
MYSKLLVSVSAVLPLAAAIPLDSLYGRSLVSYATAAGPTCSSSDSKQLSCHNTTKVTNTCCFNSPGGQLLQTQFWDSNPATGPDNSWTVHGLWPDNCDGSFQQFCDSSRESTDITGVLQSFGQTDLLDFMNTYWKTNSGTDEVFWEHEWNKHGTCISTFDAACYPGAKKGQDIVDFFTKTTDLFKTLTTYDFLSAAGITPSTTKTYTLAQIQAAIVKGHGKEATVNCASGALDEVWYHFNVYGSAQSGQYVAANPIGSKSTCPSSGIKYLPKNGGGSGGDGGGGSGGGGGDGGDGGSGDPFSGKGYMNVDKGGCLISTGKWYTKGTCATFTAAASGSGFTLKSSKGTCGIVSGQFQCGSGVSSTTFTTSGNYLANGNSSSFSASGDASGGSQVNILTSGGSTAVKITWQSV